jgi:hypothetical protein
MRLFLFLDDWLLDSRVDVVRKYCPAKFIGVVRPPRDVVLTPYWNTSRKCYEASVRRAGEITLMESADGRAWRKAPVPRLKVVGRPPRGCAISPHLMERFKGIDVFSSMPCGLTAALPTRTLPNRSSARSSILVPPHAQGPRLGQAAAGEIRS